MALTVEKNGDNDTYEYRLLYYNDTLSFLKVTIKGNRGKPAPTPLIIPHFLTPVKPAVVAIIQQ